MPTNPKKLITELRLQARINSFDPAEEGAEPEDYPEITWSELDGLAQLMRRAADALEGKDAD